MPTAVKKPEPPAEPERPAPTNVIEALARVQAEIGGVRKLTAAERRRLGLGGGDADERGVPYAYRGIDQIAAAAQPLFGEYGIVIVPTASETSVRELLVRNNPWTEHHMKVTWTIYGPNGTSITAESEGLGRDNSDKGINKAITSCFKNLLLRVLCIGDPADDSDHERTEEDAREPEPDPVLTLWGRIEAAKGSPYIEALKTAKKEFGRGVAVTAKSLAENPEWFEVVKNVLDDPTIGDFAAEATAQEASGEPEPAAPEAVPVDVEQDPG